MKKYLVKYSMLLLMIFSGEIYAQDLYWVAFTNKNNSKFSISNPSAFLSQRAIERRSKQHIAIDSLDLPVNSNYISGVLNAGANFIHASKWLNGITIQATSDSFKIKAAQLPFVKEVQLTKPVQTKSAIDKFAETESTGTIPIDPSKYGPSVYQVSTLNGQLLHNRGYWGKGIQIAVLDGGFLNADIYNAFDSLRANGQILGTRDLVFPKTDIYRAHYHGMSVLSCMGGNVPGQLLGTAPKASYWLIRSEDTDTEYIVEEDNWVVAAEFADSAGVDIINSSLGYNLFGDPQTNHVYANMDGKTTRVTQGANIAVSRGMLVFSSAGNEGNNSWRYLIAPSDGEKIIGVGAVNKDTVPASFTSHGPAWGGKTKPNVSAIGWNTWLVRSNGTFGYSTGTLFSSPVMAGMAACLWQSVPNASAAQVKEAIEWSAHRYTNPDTLVGYGVPDMQKAWTRLITQFSENHYSVQGWKVYPNPFQDRIILQSLSGNFGKKVNIEVFTLEGKLIKRCIEPGTSQIEINNLGDLPSGILIMKVNSETETETFKISKLN